jgi:hypothetical protein
VRWLIVVAITVMTQRAEADCVDEARELRAHLTREAKNARTWNTLWAIGFGGAAVAQLGFVAGEVNPIGDYDDAFEEQMYVGAAKASLGAAVRVVLPLKLEVPAANEDACTDVKQLRAAVEVAGRKERRSVWLTIVGGTLVNLAGSALLWSRHDFGTAAQSFATGAVVGPISAFTQPRKSWKRWNKHRTETNVQVGLGVRGIWIAGTF